MKLCDHELMLRPRGPRDQVRLDWSGDVEAERFGLEIEDSPWSGIWDRRRRQAFWIVLEDAVVGEAEIFDIRRGDRTAELRIGIAPAALLGRGYGRRALQLLVRHAQEHLQLESVYLRVREENQRAVRCYRRCGFRAQGRLSGQHFPAPVLLMSCVLRERPVERPLGETLVERTGAEVAAGELPAQGA